MFRFYSGGDEFRSIAFHLRQQPLSSLVNEGDVTQIYDAADSHLAAAFPTRAQLGNPRTRQSSAERPPLFFLCLRVCDPQHYDLGSPLLRVHTSRQSLPLRRRHAQSADSLEYPGLLRNRLGNPAGLADDESPVCYRDFGI
jgi:hypothetical protein